MSFQAWTAVRQHIRPVRIFRHVSVVSGRIPSTSPRHVRFFIDSTFQHPTTFTDPTTRFRLLSTSSDIERDPEVHRQPNEDDEDSSIDDILVDEEELSDTSILTEEDLSTLPRGTNNGFYVVKHYTITDKPFDFDHLTSMVDASDVQRLELSPTNISVPVALMMLDPSEYPTLSRARKACRKANILIHRGPLAVDPKTGDEIFDQAKCITGRVGDRVFPGDVVGKQVRMGDGYFPIMGHKKPPFDLPVVYEDDFFAIVNKPAGVVVYATRNSGHGTMTVRAGLPFVLTPPRVGTYSTLRRPQPVHRLDKPTSGLLLIGKTKPAMVHLSLQFRDRKIKKTYTAIVNGIPPEPKDTTISSEGAYGLGVDVDPKSADEWQLIDYALDEKSSVTIWRALRYAKSLKANDNVLTLVELKPKTGRYHQLRRHMAWVCERPIIGDMTYDGGGAAMQLRERGLFLCSNRVTLEHPFYNSEMGRQLFDKLDEVDRTKGGLWISEDGMIMVTAEIDLPEKFHGFMSHEDERYVKISNQDPLPQ